MKRVLIIDEEKQQRVAASRFAEAGFEVLTATSAHDALDLVARQTVDVVVVDLMIPGLNGLELARQIHRAHPTVKVVGTSTYCLSARQIERAWCGQMGFLPKPYDVHAVADLVA